MRVGLIQLCSSDDPVANLSETRRAIRSAARGAAEVILTPEVTNCVSASRARQNEVLRTEAEDMTLATLRDEAKTLGVTILIGSLALKEEGEDRFVNRSFLIDPEGNVTAKYDKIHMFDVQISETETYRESAGYKPGSKAVVAEAAGELIGMTICYDVRFPQLYRDLAHAGARILTVPSAFSPETGAAHWQTLLCARAIENGCFVLAPAQSGAHTASVGRRRRSYGHSLAIDPWGRVLSDGGEAAGVTLIDLDMPLVDDVRRRLPSLTHDRTYERP